MAGADITRFAEDRRGERANLFLIAASGALAALADGILLPLLLPVVFVSALTDSYLAIAAVPAIAGGLWAVPQLAAGSMIRGRGRKLPWATGAAIVRAATIGLLAVVGFRAERLSDDELLRAFFICYLSYTVAAGLAAALGDEVARRSLPAGRGEALFRVRGLWGGGLAFLAGLAAARTLGDAGPGFPDNVARLFALAATALGSAVLLQALIREPGRLGAMGSAVAPRFSLDAWLEPLTNPTVRRFLTVRLVLALAAIADPFYVVYGLRELDLELTAIGYFLAALVGARLLAGPLWSFGLRRRGSRTVLQLAGLCRLLVPLVALLLPYLAETELYRERVTDARVTSALFGLVFAVYGLALAGLSAGSFAFLLDAVSPPERSHTFALTNLLLGAVALVPFAGALLVEAYSFETVFLAATLATLTGIFLTGALPDTNVRVRTGAAAWRLRRARP